MINIVNKEDCVGCNACVQSCPVSCISMHSDEQGFMYPKVDLDRCINCSLCERVCPVIVEGRERKPLKVMAAVNTDDEIRRRSSSGGVFYALAKATIENGGVVFGARFDSDWNVVHDYTENIEGIAPLMGSKYVQSQIGDSFIKADGFLKAGRKVMFCGTSCQIEALKLFLRKDYGDLLLAVEMICHGVPSPAIWRDYLVYRKKNVYNKPVTAVSFRDKQFGWERFCLSISFNNDSTYRRNLNSDPYISGFLRNMYLRPSCFKCPSKCGKSESDIALGDFWHIRYLQPEDYHFNGVSLVLAYTEHGMRAVENTNLELSTSTYEIARRANSAITESAIIFPERYNTFWSIYNQLGITGLIRYVSLDSIPLHRKLKMGITYILKILFVRMGINKY